MEHQWDIMEYVYIYIHIMVEVGGSSAFSASTHINFGIEWIQW